MKYDVKFTSQFKKDLKLAKKQNKNIDKLYAGSGSDAFKTRNSFRTV